MVARKKSFMKEIFGRANQYLLFVILLTVILYFGRTFLIPIAFGGMLAMLMAPICRKLDQWGFHRALSSLTCILILAGVVVGIGAIVGAQFSAFAEDIDQIKTKGKEMLAHVQDYVEDKAGVSPEEQKSVVRKQAESAQRAAGGAGAGLLASISSAIAGMALTLVFTFLFFFGKEKYEQFFLRLYSEKDKERVRKVVGQITHVAQQYLTGRAISVTIIAVMYAIGLSIVDIKNAILLAGIAALLTVVPYVGTVLGGMIPVMMALVTEDSYQPALLAALVMFLIQTADNYFIEPHVVGGEVNLSALVSILSIIAGGMLWGVAGMILFLPMVGIAKIICDHVEPLKAIGFLVGDQEKDSSKVSEWIKSKLFRRPTGKRNRHS